MCNFCTKIISEIEYVKARVKGGDFIFIDEDSYNILIDTGDSGCLGVMQNVKYCPYCGREL